MGNFDSLFRTLGQTVTKLFVNTPAVLKRVRQIHIDETDETTTVVDKEVEVLITPPFPFNVREVNGDSILDTDLTCYLPAKSLEAVGFDPVAESNVQIIIEIAGQPYSAVAVKPMPGGDQMALYEVQLRH